MKTVAYLRVSTGSQDLANQKMAVLDYARQKRFPDQYLHDELGLIRLSARTKSFPWANA